MEEIKVKSKASLKESYLGQTVEDFLYDCNNADDIQITIFDTESGKELYKGYKDEMPDYLLNTEFEGMDCLDSRYNYLCLNVSQDDDEDGSSFYSIVEEFLEDVNCNDQEIHIWDTNEEKELYAGSIDDLPDDLRMLVFLSFEAPDDIMISIDASEIEEVQDSDLGESLDSDKRESYYVDYRNDEGDSFKEMRGEEFEKDSSAWDIELDYFSDIITGKKELPEDISGVSLVYRTIDDDEMIEDEDILLITKDLDDKWSIDFDTYGLLKQFNKPVDLSEARHRNEGFEDEDICIYLFPEIANDEDREVMKQYNLQLLGVNFGPYGDERNDVIKGRYIDLLDFCEDYIGGYEMNPDYLYKEEDFAGDIYDPEAEVELSEAYQYVDYIKEFNDKHLEVNLDNFLNFDPNDKHTLAELEVFASQMREPNVWGSGWKNMTTKYYTDARRPNKAGYLDCCIEGKYLFTKILDFIKKRDGLKETPSRIDLVDAIEYFNEDGHMFKNQKEKVTGRSINLSETLLGDRIDNFIDELYIMRQASIQKDGEYGMGNLIFKELRNRGYLDNLKELKVKEAEKELSL